MGIKELEYKYDARLVNKDAFLDWVENYRGASYGERVYDSSVDTYYAPFSLENRSFMRYRANREKPEITLKVPTEDPFLRYETDLILGRAMNLQPHVIQKFCELLGYRRDFSLTKWCDIYHVGDLAYVYYEVRKFGKTEIDKYVEIEVDKTLVSENYDEALRQLRQAATSMSKQFPGLKLLRTSLFDIYRSRNVDQD